MKKIKIVSIALLSCVLLILSACSIVLATTSDTSENDLSNGLLTSNGNVSNKVLPEDKANLKSMIFNLNDCNKTYRIYMTDKQLEEFKNNGLIPNEISTKSTNDIENYLKSTYVVEEITK